MKDDPLNRPISGCQALGGCIKQHECLRHTIAKEYPFVGFNAHKVCRTEDYPYFLPNVNESA